MPFGCAEWRQQIGVTRHPGSHTHHQVVFGAAHIGLEHAALEKHADRAHDAQAKTRELGVHTAALEASRASAASHICILPP